MITYATLSKKGSREINEDSLGCILNEAGFLAVLADGLGGHGQGEVASAVAVQTALDYYNGLKNIEEEMLPACMKKSNEAILMEQEKQNLKNDMKTTLSILHIKEKTARWLHVGDSRIYRFRKGKLIGRTLDHSVPQMLVAQGEIKEQDIRFHEDRNRLLRVVGMPDTVPKYELSEATAIDATTSFLLCSDGFWELIDEKEMVKQLKKAATPEEWLSKMEPIVLEQGKGKNMDNYSAVVVFIR